MKFSEYFQPYFEIVLVLGALSWGYMIYKIVKTVRSK